jgi:hypothetical protein
MKHIKIFENFEHFKAGDLVRLKIYSIPEDTEYLKKFEDDVFIIIEIDDNDEFPVTLNFYDVKEGTALGWFGNLQETNIKHLTEYELDAIKYNL